MKMLARRDFVKLGLWACGGVLAELHSPISFGAPIINPDPKKKFFVRIKLNGGWDTTLCFDPWIEKVLPDGKDLHLEYSPSEIRNREEIFLGPSAHSLEKFAHHMVVINGVVMGLFDQGHPSAISYMDTGSNKGLHPSFSVQLSQGSRSGPYGILTNGSLTKMKSKVDSNRIEDILNSRRDPPLHPHIKNLIRTGSLTGLVKAQKSLFQSKDVDQMIRDSINRFEKKFKQVDSFHVMASCFLANASFQADLTWFKGLDTHTLHVGRHRKELKGMLDEIGKGLEFFQTIPYGGKGQTLYDHTIFMISSEFSRSPWLNASGGKDHNSLTNSVVLIGRDIQGGRTIGKSKLIPRRISPFGLSYQIGYPFDFNSGRIVEAAESKSTENSFIRPENVFKTVAMLLNGEESYFAQVYNGMAIIPGIRKT